MGGRRLGVGHVLARDLVLVTSCSVESQCALLFRAFFNAYYEK